MFEIIECKTANEFLDILNPINPLKRGFPDNEKEAFLYRGQEDASFKLLPACFRTYCDKKTFESIVSYKDLVLKAVNMDGTVLKYASDTLKDDKEVVDVAIKNDINAIEFASNRLIKNSN